MRKIISIFLLLTIFFTLTACGSKTEENTGSKNEPTTPVIEERTCRLYYNNEITGRTNVLFKILSKGYFVRPKEDRVLISVGEDECSIHLGIPVKMQNTETVKMEEVPQTDVKSDYTWVTHKMTMKTPESNNETITYIMYSNCNIENAKASFMITGEKLDMIKDIASKITIEKWSSNENKNAEN